MVVIIGVGVLGVKVVYVFCDSEGVEFFGFFDDWLENWLYFDVIVELCGMFGEVSEFVCIKGVWEVYIMLLLGL